MSSAFKQLSSQHPAHSAITITLLLLSFLFITRYSVPLLPTESIPYKAPTSTSRSSDLSLAQRLERSERMFQHSKARRRELDAKFPAVTLPYPDPHTPPYPALTWWDYIYPSFNCPHEMERIGGVGDGGKWVCGLSRVALQPTAVLYSFGINYESSFEAEVMERASNVQVWGYDFSVDNFGPEITDKPDLVSRSHFKAWGLAGADAHGPNDKFPMYTLQSLMDLNGHSFIDILKIDIETYEFDVLTDLLKHYEGRPLPFGQLQIEIHAWETHFPKKDRLLAWWEALEDAGLRPFMNEPNLVYMNYNRDKAPELQEYSFLNIRGRHAVIVDA